MHEKSALVARELNAFEDGSFRAVRLALDAGNEVDAWAGRLRAQAIAKDTGDIVASDFSTHEAFHFASADAACAHFSGTEYELLVGELRDALGLLGAGAT